MTKIFLAAGAVIGTALVSTGLSAQNERSSSVPAYHLVQLSVKSTDVAPDAFKAKTEEIRSCEDAVNLGGSLDAEVTRNRFVRASQLPDRLNAIVEELPTGHATPVFTDDGSVLRVLVLCNRA